MNHHYADIRDRINEEPKWWDEHAVPRYCDFTPNQTANIYADKCALVLIGCQGCHAEFEVAFSESRMGLYMSGGATLEELIINKTLHYGDPPNTNCCPAGATMNSIPIKVLEFWDRSGNPFDQVRRPELEVEITPEWAKR